MLVSDAAANASLAMSYGTAKGASAPTNLAVALFNGDPVIGGTELDSTGGYVRLVLANDGTTWPSAPSGRAIVSSVLEWPDATGAYSDTATHFLIYDDDTGDAWDSGQLADEISIDAAGQKVRGELTVYYEEVS